jgi:serine/threonine-protein kinase
MTLPHDPASLKAEDLPISLGRYELLSVLGRGGMGVVFGARLKGPAGFSKPVALKLLSSAEGGPTREEFFQEARLGGLLWHPNLVGIHDCGVEDGHPFIVMDWVENVTVSRLIQVAAPFPPPLCWTWPCRPAPAWPTFTSSPCGDDPRA